LTEHTDPPLGLILLFLAVVVAAIIIGALLIR
jgi:hypothetical protein